MRLSFLPSCRLAPTRLVTTLVLFSLCLTLWPLRRVSEQLLHCGFSFRSELCSRRRALNWPYVRMTDLRNREGTITWLLGWVEEAKALEEHWSILPHSEPGLEKIAVQTPPRDARGGSHFSAVEIQFFYWKYLSPSEYFVLNQQVQSDLKRGKAFFNML